MLFRGNIGGVALCVSERRILHHSGAPACLTACRSVGVLEYFFYLVVDVIVHLCRVRKHLLYLNLPARAVGRWIRTHASV